MSLTISYQNEKKRIFVEDEECVVLSFSSGCNLELWESSSDNVISFSISGTAEVDAELTAALSNEKDVYLTLKKGGTEDTVTYRPIVWTLKKDSETAKEYKTISNFFASISYWGIIRNHLY